MRYADCEKGKKTIVKIVILNQESIRTLGKKLIIIRTQEYLKWAPKN